MKLDRNINPDGRGKYALVLMRNTQTTDTEAKGEICNALATLERHGCLDYGDEGSNDFFVIRLKDKFAPAALFAYSVAAETEGEQQWALEVRELAQNAARHPNQKLPD